MTEAHYLSCKRFGGNKKSGLIPGWKAHKYCFAAIMLKGLSRDVIERGSEWVK